MGCAECGARRLGPHARVSPGESDLQKGGSKDERSEPEGRPWRASMWTSLVPGGSSLRTSPGPRSSVTPKSSRGLGDVPTESSKGWASWIIREGVNDSCRVEDKVLTEEGARVVGWVGRRQGTLVVEVVAQEVQPFESRQVHVIVAG